MLGPNGAICAAEMKDKRQIFDHLVNTSLLTAPIISQAYSGKDNLIQMGSTTYQDDDSMQLSNDLNQV